VSFLQAAQSIPKLSSIQRNISPALLNQQNLLKPFSMNHYEDIRQHILRKYWQPVYHYLLPSQYLAIKSLEILSQESENDPHPTWRLIQSVDIFLLCKETSGLPKVIEQIIA